MSVVTDEGDMANLCHNRAIVNTLIESRADRLRSIEEAVQRIDLGQYGSCTRCEEDIQIKRLVAMPWATLCFRCQTELERVITSRSDNVFAWLHSENDDDSLCA
jgi:DnaK suppressor protein